MLFIQRDVLLALSGDVRFSLSSGELYFDYAMYKTHKALIVFSERENSLYIWTNSAEKFTQLASLKFHLDLVTKFTIRFESLRSVGQVYAGF